MNVESDLKPFRLLDLPPELRNRVYHFALEDTGEHELDLLCTRPYQPHRPITAICRKVRSESLGLYQGARAKFFRNHSFHISIDRSMEPARSLARILPKLPRKATVYSLVFILLSPMQDVPVARVEVETSREEDIVWTVMVPPLIERSLLLENCQKLLLVQLKMAAADLRMRLLSRGRSA